VTSGNGRRLWLAGGVLLLAGLLGAVLFSDLLADVARRAATLQQQLNRDLVRELRGVQSGGVLAAWGLMALGFGYGVLHTLGPGHGKAVVVAYFLDPQRRMGWLDGILAGAWIAITHTVSAIVLVGVLFLITRPSPLRAIGETRSLELVSYALITAIGLWRLYAGITGRGHVHCHDHDHSHGGGHHDHAHHDHAQHDHGHHDNGHAARPRGRVRRFLSLDSGLGLLTAAGIVPCSGAVILMLLAAALNLIWAGVAGVIAIALGMAVTLAAVGIGSMLAHRLLIGGSGSAVIGRVTTILAALVVIATGGFMLSGALYRAFGL
jgi:nickel/cobalt exporter